MPKLQLFTKKQMQLNILKLIELVQNVRKNECMILNKIIHSFFENYIYPLDKLKILS
jgi:hypothetical protein